MDLPASLAPPFQPDLDAAFARLQGMEQDGASGRQILRHAITGPLGGRIAVVSSFGAESAILLSIVADIDPSVPVIFLETGKHFPETLAYREVLATHLGLTDMRDASPGRHAVDEQDPDGELWYYEQDACCRLRKVTPLEQALAPFEAWISGRKRFQATSRAGLRFVEREGGRLKLNPLADWSAARIGEELDRRALPRHPLVDRGFPSIGCSVCTRPVATGEDARAGRWSSSRKVECGIHNVPVPV